MNPTPREIGLSLGFKSVMDGRFMARDGVARTPDAKYCNQKICFTATDVLFLAQLLRELSEHDQSYFVKFSTCPRDGMYLGRCFFIDEDSVGATWAKYMAHPRVFCNIQNDDLTSMWREKVIRWDAHKSD